MVLVNQKEGGTQDAAIGAPSPQEKRPGRHAREAFLLYSCLIIYRVCGSVLSTPKRMPQAPLACAPLHFPVADDMPCTAGSITAGHQWQPPGPPHHHCGRIQTSEDEPLALLSVTFHSGDRSCVAVPHTLDPRAGHPGVARRYTRAHRPRRRYRWSVRDLSCQREFVRYEVREIREDAE